MQSKEVSNRLPLSPIESLGCDRSYKGLGLEVKELYNINSISRIYKSKAIRSRVNESSK